MDERRCPVKTEALKKITFFAGLLIALTPALFAQQPWTKIQIPRLPPFHPQEPKRIVLPNGLIIFLQEDHELPTIDGVAHTRGGAPSQPTEKVGLAGLYGEVWRTGGT